MESIPFIAWCLHHLNYWTITLLMAIESSFIPFPSEVVIPPAAYFAARNGDLNIIMIVVIATLGALIGAVINYVLSLIIGRPVVYAFANSRIGHVCLIDAAKVEQAERYFDKRGAISTLIGRMIPAIRQLISIPAGLAKMNLLSFMLYTSLGAAIWNSILVGIGAAFHSTMPKQELIGIIAHYSHIIGIAAILIVIAIVAYLIYKGVKK